MIKKLLSAVIIAIIAFSTIATPISKAQEVSKISEEAKKISKIEIESFMMEVLSDDINSEGFYEEIGTKKVDAITEMKGTEDNLTTIVTSIEDYYDLNGNFTESIIKKEVLKTDYINGLSEVEVYEKKANKPQTFKNKQSVKSVKEAEEFVLNTSDKEEIKTLFNNKFKELSTFSVNKKSGNGTQKMSFVN